MTPEKCKTICECGWRGQSTDLEFVQDPKQDDNGWWICPGCRGADCTRVACDQPGCWEQATCGTPTPDGYRQICSDHYRKLQL